jgi:hypothetical protein
MLEAQCYEPGIVPVGLLHEVIEYNSMYLILAAAPLSGGLLGLEYK